MKIRIHQCGERVDDTPVHKALREALANCLINADYHGVRGVVIRKDSDKIIFANPGYVRTGKKQAKKTIENIEKIKKYLEQHGESKTNDIAASIELSPARTRALLNSMEEVEPLGGNTNRTYHLK